ncbi:hypothetical protein FTX61_18845 [Nitriliruptoraceae bacterium ZYF776]|nr:hypothetical protein [Profundirhabdus halotolerans]
MTGPWGTSARVLAPDRSDGSWATAGAASAVVVSDSASAAAPTLARVLYVRISALLLSPWDARRIVQVVRWAASVAPRPRRGRLG